jgi:hypothetical protein
MEQKLFGALGEQNNSMLRVKMGEQVCNACDFSTPRGLTPPCRQKQKPFRGPSKQVDEVCVTSIVNYPRLA